MSSQGNGEIESLNGQVLQKESVQTVDHLAAVKTKNAQNDSKRWQCFIVFQCVT